MTKISRISRLIKTSGILKKFGTSKILKKYRTSRGLYEEESFKRTRSRSKEALEVSIFWLTQFYTKEKSEASRY